MEILVKFVFDLVINTLLINKLPKYDVGDLGSYQYAIRRTLNGRDNGKKVKAEIVAIPGFANDDDIKSAQELNAIFAEMGLRGATVNELVSAYPQFALPYNFYIVNATGTRIQLPQCEDSDRHEVFEIIVDNAKKTKELNLTWEAYTNFKVDRDLFLVIREG